MRDTLKLKSNKELGQHFLKNKNTISRICQLPSLAIDFIIEIGPGPGTLTLPLMELKKPLYVIEKDSRTKDYLESILPIESVLIQDATKIDFNKLAAQLKWGQQTGWLVSNLPYNVSAVLLRLFLDCEHFKFMTLMFQKEVGEKLLPKFALNNSLRTLVQSIFQVRLVEIVKPGAFHPPPKVDSIVLDFQMINPPTFPRNNMALLEQFVRPVFQHPRKQIFAKLKSIFQNTEVDLAGLMQKLHISNQDRAEKLTQEQIMGLFEEYQRFVSSRAPE